MSLLELRHRVEDVYAALKGSLNRRRAVVTSVAPLQIRFELSDEPLAGTPDTQVGPLMVGDLVHVLVQNRRALIIGKVRGSGASLSGDLRGTSAERVQLGMSGVLQEGMRFFDTDENREYVWSGGQWRLVAYAAGVLPAVTVPAGGTVATNVTFPTGRFTVPPVVIPGVVAGGATFISVSVSDVTTTGFTLRRGVEPTRGAYDVAASWYAIQTADM